MHHYRSVYWMLEPTTPVKFVRKLAFAVIAATFGTFYARICLLFFYKKIRNTITEIHKLWISCR